MSPEEIILGLGLEPHPEGGHFRQTWVEISDERPAGTCIYYLLTGDERSHWHRVDATEIWHFYIGAPLILSIAETETGPRRDRLLGTDLRGGQMPQLIVPLGHWQAARSTGDWSLVGCTVSPGFRFDGWELAPPDFDIPNT